MPNITGIFDSQNVADTAIEELIQAGFVKDDISLLMSAQKHDMLFSRNDDKVNRAAKGGVAGTAIGGALGALAVGLTAVGNIAIPSAGLLVSGPMISILSGAGAGAIIGGIIGALIQLGVSSREKQAKGKTVLIIHARDDCKAEAARVTLRHCGATPQAA